VSRTILPDVALDDLRTIGDPEVGVPRAITAREEQLDHVRADGVSAEASVLPATRTLAVAPIDIDVDKLEVAQQLFARYGTEIGGALLLAALPQSYATAFGAGVLGANAQLETDLARRIRRTMLFLLTVMQQAEDAEHQLQLWDPAHPPTGDRAASPVPWQVCDNLRRYHALIRNNLERQRRVEPVMSDGQPGPVTRMLGDRNFPPLNQEDLLGMLLTFSISVFEVLERYDITWTEDEQEAYLHAWDVVGAYLGIGSPAAIQAFEKKYTARRKKDKVLPRGPLIDASWHNLRPPTVDGTRVLLDQIRDRQWVDQEPKGPLEMDAWSSQRAGRILTRALLDELETAMPRSLERLPIAMMRALADNRVRTRLNLGGNGLVIGALSRLPARRVLTERFTMWSAPNVAAARMLRMMANDVTSRAAVRFLDSDDFVLPGSSDWA
jgi:hypothetical protein